MTLGLRCTRGKWGKNSIVKSKDPDGNPEFITTFEEDDI